MSIQLQLDMTESITKDQLKDAFDRSNTEKERLAKNSQLSPEQIEAEAM